MTTRIPFEKMLDTAETAAKLAGRRALQELKYLEINIKNGEEIVTQADPICQQIIIDEIRKYFPTHGILAEEGPEGDLLKIAPSDSSDIWWVIDPIDGTNNYSHGVRSFTVSIAVMKDGYPIAGLIHNPNDGCVFKASKDTPTMLNDVRVNSGGEDIHQFAGFAMDSHWPNGIPANIVAIMQKMKFRNFGTTALHLAYVASGGLVGAITNTTKLWDIAAGACLIEQAGGKITNWQGDSFFPLDIRTYHRQKLQVLAANLCVYEEVKKAINS